MVNTMNRTVLFFPGQASQYVGMGRDLYEASEEVRKLYQLASDEIGRDIAQLSFEGPGDELKRTRFTQPAILLHSLAVVIHLRNHLPRFDYAAGHSLGEYGALAVSGALSFENAVKAVARRAELMDKACQANPGTMAAIMGLPPEKVEEICQLVSVEGVVVCANYNSKNQVAVSGGVDAVKRTADLARQAGAKMAVILEVGGAFHSPLMASARDGLREYLDRLTISNASPPVVANVTAHPVSDGSQIRSYLVDQVTSPVRWSQTMDFLKNDGVTTVVEIGPGKVLTGLAKREMRPDTLVNVDTMADVEAMAMAAV